MVTFRAKLTSPAPLLFASAAIALILGIVVYLLDRQADSVYFMSDWMALGGGDNTVFGMLGQHIPTFVHVYTFILLTMALVVPADHYRQYLLPVCIGWLVLDSLFEIAQLDFFAQYIAAWLPDWFTGIPFLENTASYFLVGTFDALDLLSIALGALTAFFTVQMILKRSSHCAMPVCQ